MEILKFLKQQENALILHSVKLDKDFKCGIIKYILKVYKMKIEVILKSNFNSSSSSKAANDDSFVCL